jgi:hypothetical protein
MMKSSTPSAPREAIPIRIGSIAEGLSDPVGDAAVVGISLGNEVGIGVETT